MTELKTCPFCGGKARTFEFSWHASQFGGHMFEKPYWQVICESCKAAIGDFDSKAEAIEAWNTRAEHNTLGSEVNGETSDGYHTFNELYHHRAVLFSVIIRDHREFAWKARKHHDGTMYDGMFIVGIETPSGQATYHYDLEPYWDMFDCEEREFAPEWDGHTPDDAIARIATLGSGTLEEENAKLRELVQELWYLVNHRSGYGYAAALELIEELGIEVDG